MGALILCYRSINYNAPINPETFENNLLTLKKYGFVPVTLKDIYEFVIDGKKIPKKSVHITFDGGYADNLIYAYPLLKKYGFYSTIFVIVNKIADNIKRSDIEELKALNMADKVNEFLDKSRYLSWQELEFLQKTGFVDIQSNSLNHRACFCSNKVVKFNDSKVDEWFFEYTKDKRLGIPVYEKKWDCACECLLDDLSLRDYMHSIVAKNNGILFFRNKNAQLILKQYYKKYAKKHALNIGVEKNYERIKRLEDECFLSKKIIEDRLNKHVEFFSYPFGDYDALSKEYVKRFYVAAFALQAGINHVNQDVYELKRLHVDDGDCLEKHLKIYKSGFLSKIYEKIYN